MRRAPRGTLHRGVRRGQWAIRLVLPKLRIGRRKSLSENKEKGKADQSISNAALQTRTPSEANFFNCPTHKNHATLRVPVCIIVTLLPGANLKTTLATVTATTGPTLPQEMQETTMHKDTCLHSSVTNNYVSRHLSRNLLVATLVDTSGGRAGRSAQLQIIRPNLCPKVDTVKEKTFVDKTTYTPAYVWKLARAAPPPDVH